MKNNAFIKLLASLPIILIFLYFIPFLGVCLILLRYYMVDTRKRMSTPIIILISGFIILVPNIIKWIFNIINIDILNIPYLNNILSSSLYNVNFISYSKRLICIGIIFIIISFIVKSLVIKAERKVKNYIAETQKKDYEISKENDLKIKIKQEKARHTSYVKCPHCGSDNLLGDKFGTCKFCRRKIENSNYKG